MESRHPASFRDPAGFIFRRDGKLYRQVNRAYEPHYRHLQESGLLDLLVERGLLVPAPEVEVAPHEERDALAVLEPRPLAWITYPYEWPIGALKQAALATLEVQRLALEHGMVLKDASAFNVQFEGVRPILIDSLSFERYSEGRPWIAYGQFCRHFLAPLALSRYRGGGARELLRAHLDGIPLDLVCRLLPRRSWLSLSLLLHLHLHARMIRRAARGGEAKGGGRGGVTLQQQLGLVDNLTSWVRRLPIRYQQTHWSEYYETSTYEEESLAQKERIVGDYLAQAGGQKAVDLGANTGRFSRLAAARGLSVLACDNDDGVIEELFRKSDGRSLLSLVIDLVNPPAAGGWAHQERSSFSDRARGDVVLALALIHHLAIGNNVPLVEIARFMGRLAPALIIEFVPKSDPQVQRLLAARQDIFVDYHEDGFAEAFSSVFEVQRREPVGEMGRTLYLMTRRAAG